MSVVSLCSISHIHVVLYGITFCVTLYSRTFVCPYREFNCNCKHYRLSFMFFLGIISCVGHTLCLGSVIASIVR